jgi:hypothetical protein
MVGAASALKAGVRLVTVTDVLVSVAARKFVLFAKA